MAKLNVILGFAEAQPSGMKPVMSDEVVDVQTLDVTPSNQVSDIVADKVDQVWMLTAIGGDVWVSFGKEPIAAVGDCIPLMAGVPYTFSATPTFTVAVISE